MVSLADSFRPVDPVVLVEDLSRGRELEGPEYVTRLLDGVPDCLSIAHYVRVVKQEPQLWGLIHAPGTVIARAMDGDKPTEVSGDLRRTVWDIEAQA